MVTTSNLPSTIRSGIQAVERCPSIHLLISLPVPQKTESEILSVLRPLIQIDGMPVLRTAKVPSSPPTTAEQATRWSEHYWPCTFNPASLRLQKAPPLPVLRQVLAELNDPDRLDLYFKLARRAASQCHERGWGRNVGAVVVNPENAEVVTVAGDARWFSTTNLADDLPHQHALMRAVAMVAAKEQFTSAIASAATSSFQGQHPLTSIEVSYSGFSHQTRETHATDSSFPPRQSSLRTDAYLCNGLDIYLTHEPCVACSMAMVHSRFRACLFERRMPFSGGLCVEGREDGSSSLISPSQPRKMKGLGLFWRKELNWRVFAFQYFGNQHHEIREAERSKEETSEGVKFHA